MPATKVAGCLIDRVEVKPVEQAKAPRIRPAAPEVASVLAAREKEHPIEVGKVSYAADVAAIIQNKCQTCHRPGQVGPFSLLTYDDARKHSAMIREVVEERRMPPWHADPRYGHFVNDRSLSPQERATLMAWVDQGSPLGDPKDLPPPRTFSGGMDDRQARRRFRAARDLLCSGPGRRLVRLFPGADQLQGRLWVQAAEAVPGDRSVVHHIIVYVNDPKATGARRAAAADALHRLCPGRCPLGFPRGNRQENSGRRRPAVPGPLHARSAGCGPTAPRSGLVFAKTKPTREAFTVGIANPDLLLPATPDNVAVASSMVLPGDARLLSLFPHMHLRGKDFKFTITKPGESPQVVLSVPAYDFGWQTYYVLAEPMNLPKGTRDRLPGSLR